MNAQQTDPTTLMPLQPNGWQTVFPVQTYTTETLYDYIDGGAELYISYSMQTVASTMFSKEGIGEIRVEVFDMGESKNAFGVFSHTRTHNENRFGQGSQYFTGAQIFWKDRYFVSIIANDENDEIKNTITELAVDIDSKIKDTGKVPAIVEYLPTEFMEPDGFCYFHHYIWLNSYYFISSGNSLNITEQTDAVLAKYGTKEARYFLLIVKYPNSGKALEAINKFTTESVDLKPGRIVENGDGSWQGSAVIDSFLVFVFNAPTREIALSLLTSAQKKVTKPVNN